MHKLNDQQIKAITTYHPPTPQAIILHGMVRDTIETAMLRLNKSLPDCRELSVVNIKLEEAMYFANAAIARNHDKL